MSALKDMAGLALALAAHAMQLQSMLQTDRSIAVPALCDCGREAGPNGVVDSFRTLVGMAGGSGLLGAPPELSCGMPDCGAAQGDEPPTLCGPMLQGVDANVPLQGGAPDVRAD